MPCFPRSISLFGLLAALCGCGLGQDPVEALCHTLAAGSRQLDLVATLKPDQAAGCPGLETLHIETNRQRPCGDGCTCELSGFQTQVEVDTEAVFGTKTTYSCSAKLLRTCLGPEPLSCDAASVEGLYDQATLTVIGHQLVVACSVPDPQGGDPCAYWLTARLN